REPPEVRWNQTPTVNLCPVQTDVAGWLISTRCGAAGGSAEARAMPAGAAMTAPDTTMAVSRAGSAPRMGLVPPQDGSGRPLEMPDDRALRPAYSAARIGWRRPVTTGYGRCLGCTSKALARCLIAGRTGMSRASLYRQAPSSLAGNRRLLLARNRRASPPS